MIQSPLYMLTVVFTGALDAEAGRWVSNVANGCGVYSMSIIMIGHSIVILQHFGVYQVLNFYGIITQAVTCSPNQLLLLACLCYSLPCSRWVVCG